MIVDGKKYVDTGDLKNTSICVENKQSYKDIHFMQVGLSSISLIESSSAIFYFMMSGFQSSSSHQIN